MSASAELVRGQARVNRRRAAAAPVFEHGLARAAEPERESLPPPPRRRPTGLPLLLLAALALLTTAGVVHVRARARVLALGAEITDLTAEHGRLLDEKRRLEAERAYLRHPDYIHSVAAGRLQMVPATPDRIHPIRVRSEAAGSGPVRQGG